MRYYETYFHQVRLREFVRLAYPNRITPVFIWLGMQLGVVRWSPMLIPREDWQLDAPATLADCEEPVRSSLSDAARQGEAHGFVEPVIYFHRTRGLDNMPMVAGCLRARHTDGNFILQSLHSAPVGTPGAGCLQVVSYTTDGGMIATASNRRTYDALPGVEATFFPGAKLAVLLEQHQLKLRNSARRLVPIRNNVDLARETEQVSEKFFATMVARGIMREVRNPVAP